MIANCVRCHVRCVTGTPDPEARLLRYSDRQGYCVNCAVTDWLLHGSETVRGVIDKAPAGHFPAALRLPHVQDQFARLLAAGNAQVMAEEIDWDEVIANWDLPWPLEKGTR